MALGFMKQTTNVLDQARVVAQQAETIIELTDVVKTYASGNVRVNALRGVSLSIPRGEMVAIMGASGCGKTTLLNCMSGLDTIDAGRVRIAGTDLASLNDRQKTSYRAQNMGFIFQTYNLLPVLSAV
jgi:putative ABC transport system ATP-binding protein